MMNSSNSALEKAMTGSEYAPEASSTQAAEVSLSEIEVNHELSCHLSTPGSIHEKEAPTSLFQTADARRRSQFRYAVLACATAIIIVAIIVGTIEGVKSHERARSVAGQVPKVLGYFLTVPLPKLTSTFE